MLMASKCPSSGVNLEATASRMKMRKMTGVIAFHSRLSQAETHTSL